MKIFLFERQGDWAGVWGRESQEWVLLVGFGRATPGGVKDVLVRGRWREELGQAGLVDSSQFLVGLPPKCDLSLHIKGDFRQREETLSTNIPACSLLRDAVSQGSHRPFPALGTSLRPVEIVSWKSDRCTNEIGFKAVLSLSTLILCGHIIPCS